MGEVPYDFDAQLRQLDSLANELVSALDGRVGNLGRLDHNFFAHTAVTIALQRLRQDRLRGAELTESGMHWCRCAAAFMARIAAFNWLARDLTIQPLINLDDPDPNERRISVGAFRARDGQQEHYVHDFLYDTLDSLLVPKNMFPVLHGRFYIATPMVHLLPSFEYLYLFGVALMQSPSSVGEWPHGEKVGGTDDDFARSRNLLVDDLHSDAGLPVDDEELRKLSWWIVFPPYGYEMNDGQEYNMMTFVDQVVFKKVVERERAVEYLRALSRSRALFIRNLAARLLLVFGEGPRTPEETAIFGEAFRSPDMQTALGPMAQWAWRIERNDSKVTSTEEWSREKVVEWQNVMRAAPVDPWQTDPLLRDPEYLALAERERNGESTVDDLRALRAKHPGNWFLETAWGTSLVHSSDESERKEGEEILRRAVNETPDCPTAHFTLGTALKYQGRRDEAMALFEDAVERWPWNRQAVDSCAWLVTDGMTVFPEGGPS